MNKVSVAAVVVTCNRLALLKECVAALQAQSRPIDQIIVVENSSTDGTSEYLASIPNITVLRQANTGSSGGQFTGIKTACERGHDWVWCMDDDTVPNDDALSAMLDSPPALQMWTGFLASNVLWTDGQPHRMNTHDPVNAVGWFHTVLNERCVELKTASFVSIMFRREAVEQMGLPLQDMFIWFDDAEYTARITRKFKGFVVLDSIAIHKTAINAGPSFDRVTPPMYVKWCYGVRNHIITFRRLDLPFSKRALKVTALLRHYTKMTLTRRAPWRTFAWMARGLFYNAKVEFPTPVRPAVSRTSPTERAMVAV